MSDSMEFKDGDVMFREGEPRAVTRQGLKPLDGGLGGDRSSDFLGRAALEAAVPTLDVAAFWEQRDQIRSVSSRIAVGREAPVGTGICADILWDLPMPAQQLQMQTQMQQLM